MKIALASTNKAKKLATKHVLSKVFSDIKILTLEVNSGVSKTPLSDDEGIQGCLNRILETKRIVVDADIYVGLEGIITKNTFGVFICGWAVIEFSDGRLGIGCSSKVQVPSIIADKVQSFGELCNLVKSIYPSDLINNMDEIGTNGVITQNIYTRIEEFEDAINCALGYASNKTNYVATS